MNVFLLLLHMQNVCMTATPNHMHKLELLQTLLNKKIVFYGTIRQCIKIIIKNTTTKYTKKTPYLINFKPYRLW